ncbi:Alpha/Beta hydrolase protein [Leptodontidium sp. 2 PMI_412]|nr:Alpha/Beta hydrolase protein [Leptodontidium sp. 2 PMI_412]
MCSELFPPAKPFNQVILASGVASLTVRSLKHQQVIYDKIAARLGVQEHQTARERLKALRGVPADELVNSYVALGAPVVSWQATADGVFLKQTPSVSNLPFQKYDPSLRRVLIGDCAHEGTIFAHPLKAMQLDYPKLQQMASSSLGDETSKQLLQEYGISASSSPEDLFTRLTRLVTDAEWSQPIQNVARSFSEQDVFYYHIRDVNPFPGPNKGLSHHGVDLLYIFLTYQSYLPDNVAKLAEDFAKSWLVFANGGTPWKSYDKTQDGKSTIMYFGPSGANTEGAEESKMAYKGLQVCEKLLLMHPHFVTSLRGENIVE